jgi:hypothetical protein
MAKGVWVLPSTGWYLPASKESADLRHNMLKNCFCRFMGTRLFRQRVVGDDVQWKSIWRAIVKYPAAPGAVSPNRGPRLGAELIVPWRQILDELRKPNECRPIVVVTRAAAKIQGSDEELRVLFTFAELKCVVSFHGILIHDPLLVFHRELVVPAQDA